MGHIKADYAKIGFFVLTGLVILLAGLMIFGSGALFKRTLTVETYFDDSVQGLEVGSDVKYRGVTVGSVKEISFVSATYSKNDLPDEAPDFETRRMFRYIRVVFTIDQSKHARFAEDALARMVKNGMRVQMRVTGITGVVFLEMDYGRDREAYDLPYEWEPVHFYIPSTPSTLTAMALSMERVFERLNGLDIEGGLKNVSDVCGQIALAVGQIDVPQLSKQVGTLFDDLHETNTRLAHLLGSEDTLGTLKELRETMAQLKLLSTSANESLPDAGRRVEALAEKAELALERISTLTTREEVEGLVQDLRSAIRAFQRFAGRNEVPVLTTLESLNGFLEQAESFFEEFRQDPSRVIYNSPLPEDK